MLNALRFLKRSVRHNRITELEHAYKMARANYIYAEGTNKQPGPALYACCTHLLSTGCYSESLADFQELLSLEDRDVPESYWRKVKAMLDSLQMTITMKTVFGQ